MSLLDLFRGKSEEDIMDEYADMCEPKHWTDELTEQEIHIIQNCRNYRDLMGNDWLHVRVVVAKMADILDSKEG